jgi:hypothetical protein
MESGVSGNLGFEHASDKCTAYQERCGRTQRTAERNGDRADPYAEHKSRAKRQERTGDKKERRRDISRSQNESAQGPTVCTQARKRERYASMGSINAPTTRAATQMAPTTMRYISSPFP